MCRKIIDNLKATDRYDDTIIIFTSEPGEYLGNHNRIHKGMPGHDCISHVPMIVKHPEYYFKRCDGMMNAVDFIPTLLEMAKIKPNKKLKGYSQVPQITEGTKVRDQTIIQSFNSKYQGSTLVTNRYKYYLDNEKREFLIDKLIDPDEIINFANQYEYQTIKSKLQQKLILKLMDISYSKRKKSASY